MEKDGASSDGSTVGGIYADCLSDALEHNPGENEKYDLRS